MFQSIGVSADVCESTESDFTSYLTFSIPWKMLGLMWMWNKSVISSHTLFDYKSIQSQTVDINL